MKLPNVEAALIAPAKIRDYLLSYSHPFGRGKAAFFRRLGFSPEDWHELSLALVNQAAQHRVTSIEDSPFGVRYTVEGTLETPDGRDPLVRAVWFIRRGEEIPRFVTAYPVGRRAP